MEKSTWVCYYCNQPTEKNYGSCPACCGDLARSKPVDGSPGCSCHENYYFDGGVSFRTTEAPDGFRFEAYVLYREPPRANPVDVYENELLHVDVQERYDAELVIEGLHSPRPEKTLPWVLQTLIDGLLMIWRGEWKP